LRRIWMTIVLLMIVAILFPDGPRAQWRTEWSYGGALGPEHWGDLDPEYAACKTGREQSPIDIQSAEKTGIHNEAQLPAIRFEYKNGPLKIINNGYTAVRVNYAPGNGNFLIVGDKRYELTQFHFHRPSEEEIHGKPSDMVIHLMHQSADGKVVGVAILLKAGGANATIQELWKYMPQTAGAEHEIPEVQINPAGLLPHNSAENAGPYYTYAGSQTAPPCTEGVTWFVLKTPMEISAQEIAAFARLYPHDVRPVQPLNGRVVKESQ
jgi:carbonic anhydrase